MTEDIVKVVKSDETRRAIYLATELGDKVADEVTSFVGSWSCIGLHTAWFVAWFVLRLDINLLTLIVSLEAIYLATVIMMSQNRQSDRDHARDDLEAQEVESLYQINKQQLELLNQEQGTRQTLDLILQRLKELEVQAHTTVTMSGTPVNE